MNKKEVVNYYAIKADVKVREDILKDFLSNSFSGDFENDIKEALWNNAKIYCKNEFKNIIFKEKNV